jgi:hypothetical protein
MSGSLKNVLTNIVDNLEKVATQTIAIQTALIEKRTLADQEIENRYAVDAHAVAADHLAEVRRLIRLLPAE